MDAKERKSLLETLQARFDENMRRHEGLVWGDIESRIESKPDALKTLSEMERTGGEPDVIGHDPDTGEYTFCDCAPQSPKGRRSLCYDREARVARKKHPPKSSAVEMAEAIGVELLTEEEYRALQQLEEFDTKTSSWIATPSDVRDLGGAIFCDRRYGRVFTYHNGADSYYAARGFRGAIRV